jgi:hypothetical protein
MAKPGEVSLADVHRTFTGRIVATCRPGLGFWFLRQLPADCLDKAAVELLAVYGQPDILGSVGDGHFGTESARAALVISLLLCVMFARGIKDGQHGLERVSMCARREHDRVIERVLRSCSTHGLVHLRYPLDAMLPDGGEAGGGVG